jgi:regulator of sigma E protease
VIFNLVLAFGLFVWAYGIGVPVPSSRIGFVQHDSPAWKAGVRPGDLATHLDGREIFDWFDIGSSELGGPGPVVLTVERDGQRMEFALHAVKAGGELPFGLGPEIRAEAKDVFKDSPVAKAGGKPGDVVLAIDGKPVTAPHEIEPLLSAAAASAGDVEEMAVAVRVRRDGGAEDDLRVAVPLAPMIGVGPFEGVRGTRVTPAPDGAAARAGVQAGDTIVSVGGTTVASWEDVSKAIRANGTKPLALGIRRGAESITIEVTPTRQLPMEFRDLGYAREVVHVVRRERNVFRAMGLGWKRTTRFIEMVVLTVKGLVTRHVSTEAIGGPIALVAATYSMFDQGWGLYLQILGLISVNLAILNLLPVPVLDGGQIVLLCAEKLRGKPLPERIVGWLQMAGLVFILGLLVLAFRNDIARLLQ